jgi:hypothetical protein
VNEWPKLCGFKDPINDMKYFLSIACKTTQSKTLKMKNVNGRQHAYHCFLASLYSLNCAFMIINDFK